MKAALKEGSIYNGLSDRFLRDAEVDDDDEERADDVHDDDLAWHPPTLNMSRTWEVRDEDLGDLSH